MAQGEVKFFFFTRLLPGTRSPAVGPAPCGYRYRRSTLNMMPCCVALGPVLIRSLWSEGYIETGPRRGCSRMLGTVNFPDFPGKNLVPGKWHLRMQTSRWHTELLCISTSKPLLPMPFAGQNHLFLHQNKFYCLFPSQKEKNERKKKGKGKNDKEKMQI